MTAGAFPGPKTARPWSNAADEFCSRPYRGILVSREHKQCSRPLLPGMGVGARSRAGWPGERWFSREPRGRVGSWRGASPKQVDEPDLIVIEVPNQRKLDHEHDCCQYTTRSGFVIVRIVRVNRFRARTPKVAPICSSSFATAGRVRRS